MRISFIYMASGFGSRFGSNKLLVPFKGKELYRHGLDCICQAAGELEKEGHQTEVLVVSQYEAILKQAESRGLLAVPNRFSGEGITASLRLGTSSASPETEALLFSVADQPYMSTPTLNSYMVSGCQGRAWAVCAIREGGGIPLFSAAFTGKNLWHFAATGEEA